MAHGYEKHSIEEIRELLREHYGITDPDVLKQTKIPLVKLLLEKVEQGLPTGTKTIEAEEQEVDTTLDEAEPEEEVVTPDDPDAIPEVQPAFGSPGWVNYVMRQFTDDEMEKEHPRAIGCRRLVQELIGPILSEGVESNTPPCESNRGTATVVWEVRLAILNDTHPAYSFVGPEGLFIRDIADVNDRNTDAPYYNHPSATAATRAQGRIYRKLLGLHKITAEEVSDRAKEEDTPWVEDSLIQEGQIAIIDMMCRPDRCDLSVLDYINCGKKQYAAIEVIPKATATAMIQKLNRIQQGLDGKPKGVGRYDPNWRENG